MSNKICFNSNLVGLDFCSDVIKLENGSQVYFGFEKVDGNNVKFWDAYYYQASYLASYCDKFCKIETPYPNEFSRNFDYSEQQYSEVRQFIQKKKYFKENPFLEIKTGAAGMSQVLSPSKGDRKVFMAYASTVYVEKPHINEKIFMNTDLKNYNALFGHIIISFVFITEDDAPTVSHFGIFRNPISFLDTQEKYKGLSIKLHGFGATMAMKCFKGKKYMITNPLHSMTVIFIRAIGESGLHIGTNEDLKKLGQKDVQDKQLLKKFPPIYHIDPTTRVEKIAKEGVDLSEHLEVLPDKNAEFIAPERKTFNFSAWTAGAMVTIVNIEKLASFYF